MLPLGPYNKSNPPHHQGVYVIKNSHGNTKYVGESKDLFRRAGEHMNSGKMNSHDTFTWKPLHGNTSDTTRKSIETNLIQKYCSKSKCSNVQKNN